MEAQIFKALHGKVVGIEESSIAGDLRQLCKIQICGATSVKIELRDNGV